MLFCLLPFLPICIPACLPACLPIRLPKCVHVYPPACPVALLPACVDACLFACLHVYLNIWISACRPSYLAACLHTNLPVHSTHVIFFHFGVLCVLSSSSILWPSLFFWVVFTPWVTLLRNRMQLACLTLVFSVQGCFDICPVSYCSFSQPCEGILHPQPQPQGQHHGDQQCVQPSRQSAKELW